MTNAEKLAHDIPRLASIIKVHCDSECIGCPANLDADRCLKIMAYRDVKSWLRDTAEGDDSNV